MGHLRLLSALACASIALFGCGRSHLGLHNSAAPGSAGSAADGVADGMAGSGASGGVVNGSGMMGQPDDDGRPNSDMPPMRPSDTFPPPGSGMSVAGSFAPPPPFGGKDPDAPFAPDNPDAVSVLNPQRCATDEAFVLAIDPGGATGKVQGWLESAPNVIFDAFDLPRFGRQSGPEGDPEGELGLWWSIASLSDEDRSFWFYPANAATEVAHVQSRRLADIGDARALMYTTSSIGPVAVGEIAVFHHIPSDRFLAVQAVDLYGTEDSDRRELCAAIDARWFFAPDGTADFSGR